MFTLASQVLNALSAGLRVSRVIADKGIQFIFTGYNQKLLLLIEMEVQTLRKLSDECEAIFEMQKEQKKKSLSNDLLNASNLSYDVAKKLIESEYWTDFDYLNEIDKINFETMQKFVEKFFRRTKIQILVQGNMLRAQALEVVNILDEHLPSDALERVRNDF